MAEGKMVPVRSLIQTEGIRAKFENVLQEKAAGFLASISSAVSANESLQKCDSMSVMGAAMIAATLDLPINQNLGFAYIIPYYDKNKGNVAQFQMGYKAYIQLALRTGQYKTINATEIYEDELDDYNPMTESVTFTDRKLWKMRRAGRTDKIIGYLAYFELLNGFTKTIFKYTEEIEAHAKQYSANYKKYGTGLWKDNFKSMALKTVIKELISKWGIMNTQMAKATTYDYGTVDINNVDDDSAVEYLDNPNVKSEDAKPKSVEEVAGDIFGTEE